MQLREQILQEHSKSNCTIIVQWVGSSQARFDELIQLFLKDTNHTVVQRAAWPMSFCVINHPALISKHFGKLVKNLQKPGIHDAVKRNTVRLLQEVTIPEKYHGEIMDTCFTYISSPNEAAAVKAFSLTILENLSAIYPDIQQELKTIIEERWDYETAAFKSRARKILAKQKR